MADIKKIKIGSTTYNISPSWNNITGKPSTYPPDSHTHTKSEVGLGNVDNTADANKSVNYANSAGSVAWENVTGKPSTFTPSGHTHDYLPLSGGTMTGSIKLKETNNILLRPSASDYTSGIGYDTRGDECIALWAKSAATRLRWHAGVDMSTSTYGMMMDRTPDFEISKASGTATGYIGGKQISVDGHTHTSISAVASINGENTANYPWRRIMSVPSTTSSWVDAIGTYYLSGNYNGGPYYLFRMEFRTNHSAVGAGGNFNIRIIATNSDPNNIAIASYSVVTNGVTTNYSDVFVKVPSYPRMVLTRLGASDTGTIIYYNSKEGSNASSRTEAYNGINGSGTGYASYELHGISEYTNISFGEPTAKVLYATGAEVANYLSGFTSKNSTQEWGNRTGTFITGMQDSTGGSIAWRRDNPNAGQMSMIIDGTVYVNEGQSEVIHTGNIGSQNVNYANSAGSVAWSNVTGKPVLYNHFLIITFTHSSRTYKCKVNILSSVSTKITTMANLASVCRGAINIYQTSYSNRYYWSMPAEGALSNNETDTSQNYITFRIFIYYDYAGEQVIYAYYINKSNSGSNFEIANSYSGVRFSDTVTTIYGGA